MTNTHSDYLLIVEDDERISRLLHRYLAQSGFTVQVCANKAEMDAQLEMKKPDCLILDLLLPDAHGVDKVVGLEVGADDYITKPFESREVLARVRTLLRRLKLAKNGGPKVEVVRAGDLVMDFSRHTVTKAGNPVNLTGLEFTLLAILVKSKSQPLSRDQLLAQLSGRDWQPNDRSVDVLVGKIRKKIEADPARPQLIKTLRGKGYLYLGEA
jgi:two-component system, OmpR family, response regulator